MWSKLRRWLFPDLARMDELVALGKQQTALLQQLLDRPAQSVTVHTVASAPGVQENEKILSSTPSTLFIPRSVSEASKDTVQADLGSAVEHGTQNVDMAGAAERLAKALKGKK
jgi:hypothetical protein